MKIFAFQFSLNEEIVSLNVEQAKAFTVWANIWTLKCEYEVQHTHTHKYTRLLFKRSSKNFFFAKANPNWFSIKNYYGIRTDSDINIWKVFWNDALIVGAKVRSRFETTYNVHRINSNIVIIHWFDCNQIFLAGNEKRKKKLPFNAQWFRFICAIFSHRNT